MNNNEGQMMNQQEPEMHEAFIDSASCNLSENDTIGMREKILAASIELFATYGYYGTSFRQISDMVGLSKSGLVHYTKSKRHLMAMVLERYDRLDTANQYVQNIMSYTTEQLAKNPPLFPDFARTIVSDNAKRPILVRMFSVLNAESLEPTHPAHAYFRNHEKLIREGIPSVPWKLPPGVDVHKLIQACYSMMDGIQLRWLMSDRDLVEMWGECEDVLFPYPQWQGYR